MTRIDPDRTRLRLLGHIRRAIAAAGGAPLLCTVEELAEPLGISTNECQHSLTRFVRQNELRLRIHAGGRYEIQLPSS